MRLLLARPEYNFPAIRLSVFVLMALGVLIAGRKAGVLGPGGDAFLLLLGFGFIPDLIDGHGEDAPRPVRLSGIEEDIRTLLDGLSEDFHVLRDLDTPHGPLRHVVFSRTAGVFVIEAKPEANCTRGAVDGTCREAGGPESHVLDRCACLSYWLRERITEIAGEKPWITPLLVASSPFVPADLRVDGVRIVNRASLLPTLSERGGRRRRSNHIWEARYLIADSLES